MRSRALLHHRGGAGVEDYIHRIGRTGRAGATGESYTFMTYDDGKHARELAQVRGWSRVWVGEA